MYRHEQVTDSSLYLRHLEGPAEVIDLMQDARAHQERSGLRAASLRTDRKEWFGTSTMEEAIELARYGWEEGRQHLQQAIGRVAVDRLVGQRLSVEAVPDYAGDEVDIDAYLHGDPEHMIEYQLHHDTGGKRATVLVQCSMAARVSSERIIRRGGAIYAAIEALRAEGYSLGLTMVETTEPLQLVEPPVKAVEYHIPVTRPGEYLGLDTAAFCLAHPSFLRRGVFAVNEHEPESLRWAMGFHDGDGYGVPTEMVSDLPENSFVIDQGEGLDLDTDEEVQQFAQSVVTRSLVALGRTPA